MGHQHQKELKNVVMVMKEEIKKNINLLKKRKMQEHHLKNILISSNTEDNFYSLTKNTGPNLKEISRRESKL